MLRTVVAIGCVFSLLFSSSRALADDAVLTCVKHAEDAQSQRSSHQLRAARLQFLLCAQEACPLVVRQDCAGWLADVDTVMPSIVVQARDVKGVELTDVRVSVDGQVLAERLDGLAIPVDPGVHLFQFERVGVPPLQQQILIREGEKGRALPITLAAAPQPPDPRLRPAYHPRPLTYILGGLGIAGIAGFSYFAIKGTTEAHAISQEPCAATKTCDKGRVDAIHRELVVGDIALVIGLASLGTATYLYFSDKQAHAQSSALQAQVFFGPGMGRVSVSGQF